MGTILVIAPHMDDELLGVGGTIRRHVDAGDTVHVCIVAHRVYNRKYSAEANIRERQAAEAARQILGYASVRFLDLPDERLDACVQDVLIPLEATTKELRPETVYVNFAEDNHQDHRAVFAATRVVCRPASGYAPRRVLMYETPSSTEQSPPLHGTAFQPNLYVDISSALEIKLRALACYGEEGRTFPHPRSPESIRARALCRGAECGCAEAEAFVLLRDIWT